MFCPLMQVELKVETCPVRCIYKGQNNKCEHDQLTVDNLEIKELARLKGVKVYKMRDFVGDLKEKIKIGIIVLRYSEYIKESFPVQGTQASSTDQPVGEIKTSKVYQHLKDHFGLSKEQQTKFWNQTRYDNWAQRNNIDIKITVITQFLQTFLETGNKR